MRLPPWLVKESEAWQQEGLITDAQRRAILGRYPDSHSASRQASSTLTWLAALVAGIGAVVLVVWNWTSIPTAVKILLSAGPMVGLYGAAVVASRANRPVRAQRLALVAALCAGGVLGVTEDLSHMDPQHTDAALLWAVMLSATALLTPSAPIAAVGTAVLGWWVLASAERPEALWWLLAVWPLLALTMEREANRWIAGGLTVVFGLWVFIVVIGTWTEQAALAGVAVVLTGTWLETLARVPIGRRPAVARTTPALALTLLGLMLLLISAVHRTMGDWHLATGSPWPGLALIAGLVCGTGWHAWRTGAWWSRPVALTTMAASWLIAWLTLPDSMRTNLYLQWAWTTVFSAAVIVMGASAVREAARTRDLGQFIVGLLCVVGFVIVRVIDARSLVVSGLMLLTSALVLWWLGHLWATPATTEAAS